MKKSAKNWRLGVVLSLVLLTFGVLIVRLFYWQVLANEQLAKIAKSQYSSLKEVTPIRGEILAGDNFPLATNNKVYLLYASVPELKRKVQDIADLVAPIIVEEKDREATQSASESLKKELIIQEKKSVIDNLKANNLVWVPLAHRLSENSKKSLESLNIEGLGFEEEQERFYPEASMAAQLLGFVGKNDTGKDTGYFGLEGFYDLELRGRQGLVAQETDVANKPILIGSFSNETKKDGQSLVLHLDRSIQLIVEDKLQKAVEKYKAKSGSVIIMDPYTGGILALANWPSYDQRRYFVYDKTLYGNPLISETYEPGSTFKIFIMSAALDQKIVKPETKCTTCDQAYKIDKYLIKNWDDKYHPQANMSEVIQYSDNVGMVYVANQMGIEKMWDYLKKFGFGEETKVDLQGENPTYLKAKKEWNQVDLATASFGQGLAVTGIQMVRACAVIANGGKLIEPHVVKEVITSDKKIAIKPKTVRDVISQETAKTITQMMVQAVEKGETKYLKIPGYKIAGKTGTAQIPVAGHYDEEKTIASFIGFGPTTKPRFVMLVKLREPQSSPWGSETAAPLFYSIAKELFTYFGIQPD